MAQQDESVARLEAFIATMQAAKVKAKEAEAAVDEQANDLDALDDKAEAGIAGFNEALDGFEGSLRAAEQESVAQLDRVATEGERTADDRLVALGRTLDEGETDFANSLPTGCDDLDRDAAALETNGFRFLQTALETVEGELDTALQQAMGAFEALDDAVRALEQHVSAAFDQGQLELETSMGTLAEEGRHLQAHVTECELFMHASAGFLDSECTQQRDATTRAYEERVEVVDDTCRDLVDSVKQLGEDAAGFVANSSADDLDAPVGLVTGGMMPPLLEELTAYNGVLTDGEQTVSDVDALSIDLEKCERVVNTIDQTLNALQ